MYILKEEYNTSDYYVADINILSDEEIEKIKTHLPEFIEQYFIKQ